MKKSYVSPELDFVIIQLNESICLSNPEGEGGGGNWGDDGEE